MSKDLVVLSDDYTGRVRTFGALGYSPERICQLLHLNNKERLALLFRLSLQDDEYKKAYEEGRAIGEYNIDAELAKNAERGDIDAIELLESRKVARTEIDLRKTLFGV